MATYLSRRSFLAGAGAAGAVALTGNWRNALGASPEIARGGRFAQSVAAGQPTTNGITLWTKLSELGRPGTLQYEVSTDPGFGSVLARHSVEASADSDYAITTRLDTAKLAPGGQYYYRFFTCDQSSPVGRFRTARPADSQQPVRIGYFSCQDYEAGFYTAHAGLADEDDLDLVICLGDYIYERSYADTKAREDRTGANRDAEVQTLGEYRDKYRLYHTDPNLLRMRETHPLLVVWDDHEVEDNYAADKMGDKTENPRVPFSERRSNGYRAYFEHMPRVRVPGQPDRIYGNQRIGANCELFLLDERQYRSDQPCGDPTATPCAEADDPGRTMLGADQKAWLKNGLAASGATWKVVANQLMVMSLDLVAGQPLLYDAWDGYVAERRELLEYIRDHDGGIDDVAFITGDIHTFFAGVVTPEGRQNLLGSPPAVATEFVASSISSRGIADQVSEDTAGAIAVPSDANLRAQNPHIKFSNQRYKGYGVLEAKTDELLVQFKAPDSVQSPTSSVFTLESFRVPRGIPRVDIV